MFTHGGSLPEPGRRVKHVASASWRAHPASGWPRGGARGFAFDSPTAARRSSARRAHATLEPRGKPMNPAANRLAHARPARLALAVGFAVLLMPAAGGAAVAPMRRATSESL